MLLQVILEGIGLGVLLILVCAIGIRKGAVGMVHLYSPEVQNRCVTLGLTTHERIKRNALLFKAVCVPGYIAYVLVCVYALNGARGFLAGFWQLLVILSIMNLIDRFLIDGYWVGHTSAWEIPGTEDLKPYITTKDKGKKWLFGTVGMVHLYSQEVQERCVTLGLTTHAKIKRNALIFKAVCVPGYIAYVLVCVYALNGAKGFVQGFWQLLVILSVMNLIDRFWVDGYWVGHTNAWEIPGTEDLKPYITAKDKGKKWLFGTIGMAVISAALAAIMMLFMKI